MRPKKFFDVPRQDLKGAGEEATNVLCPMPQSAARLSLSNYLGMEFPAAFNEMMQLKSLTA